MKITKTVIVLLILFCFGTGSFADIESHLAGIGYQVALHPDRFFTDIQNDVEDLSGGRETKAFQLQTNIFWDLLSALNINAKYRIREESSSKSEINLNLSYWSFGIINLLQEVNTKITGISTSIIFARSIESDLKLIGGIKYSLADVSIKVDKEFDKIDDGDIEFNLDEINELNTKFTEYSPFVGINYMRDVSGANQTVFVIGYHIENKIIYSKIHFVRRKWDWGVGIYPESPLTIHPFLNYHF